MLKLQKSLLASHISHIKETSQAATHKSEKAQMTFDMGLLTCEVV